MALKNIQKTNISFAGTKESDSPEAIKGGSDFSQSSISLHPLLKLEMDLIKDGYSWDEIVSAGLEKKSFFENGNKDIKDAKAMLSAYQMLKTKFNTPDVQNHVLEQNKIQSELSAFLKERGKDVKSDKKYSSKQMILGILHNVNKNNVPLLKTLLDDENFDNCNIDSALRSFDGNKNIEYGIKTLEMAQEIGYDKEFSFPLAVIISEANENNIEAIEKMLHEQEFFVDNYDFVANGLMFFLRGYDGLLPSYKESPDLTMDIVKELKEAEDSEC